MYHTKFVYILIIFIVIILYEIYLIGFYKFQDFKINALIENIERVNEHIRQRNIEKESYYVYIRTTAYKTYIAKATQNKKLPGEEVTNIIDESVTRSNEPIDVNQIIISTRKLEESPTKNMNNRQKWQYLITHLHEYF